MSSPGTALITGAAKRVGRELALALSKKGYAIAIHYGNSKEDALSLAAQIQEDGGQAEIFQADLSKQDDVIALASAVSKKFSSWNILINNASVFEKASFRETEIDLFRHQIGVNFRAPFFLTQFFSKHCQKGNVINFLDTRISDTDTDYFIYSLSKKIFADFTQMAAKELAPDIRVNGIAPGLLLPPEGKSEKEIQGLAEKTPLKRQPELSDIIQSMFFLLENESVTGQILYINSGEHV